MVPTGGVRTLIVIKPRATPTKGEPRKGAHRKTCTVLMGYSKGSALWSAPSSIYGAGFGLKDKKSWSEPDLSALWCEKVWFKVVGGQL
mgnify:CR=1 FL=1